MTFIYAGFLSYAHADETMAARLHRALETYKIPKGHTGTLSPIFRDTTELTAHHSLSEKIQGAVSVSRVLIVLCSPAAKASHWVNEEIRLFRKLHGESAILCVLAEGTPETSFPPALLEGGREPLAANLGASKDSFRLGVTQIAAAMLGVGLDTLIQRDTKRKRSRLQAVTAAALVFSTFMGATTFSAVTARKAAETNRVQAEGLVEYMIKDMYEQLEPVARLDILGSIGERAVEYYDAQDIEKLPDESLARQARARHILGRVALDTGRPDDAKREILTAHRLTKEVLARNPDQTEAILSHAQSEYWVGWQYYLQLDFVNAQPYFQAYNDFGQTLYGRDTNKLEWIMEAGWGANNLGMNSVALKKYDYAEQRYIKALEYFKLADEISPNNTDVQIEIANLYAGLSIIRIQQGKLEDALAYSVKEIAIYKNAFEENPNDFTLKFSIAVTQSSMLTEQLIADPTKFKNMARDTKISFEELVAHDPTNQDWAKKHDDFQSFFVEQNFQP